MDLINLFCDRLQQQQQQQQIDCCSRTSTVAWPIFRVALRHFCVFFVVDGKANIIFALRSSDPWSLASSSFTSCTPFANKFMLISCILRSSSGCADIIIACGRVFRHANQSISFHQTGNSMACYKENASLTAYPSIPPSPPPFYDLSVCLFIRYIHVHI